MDALRAKQLIDLAGGVPPATTKEIKEKFAHRIDRCIFFRFIYPLLHTNLPFTGEGWDGDEGFVSGAIMVGDTIVAHPEFIVLLDGVYCDRPLNSILRSAILGNWMSRIRNEHSRVKLILE
jgi:hypothetical protein